MTGLSQAEVDTLRALAERAGDDALERLATALPDKPLGLRAVFASEHADRRAARAVFDPITPFVAPGRGLASASLPSEAVAVLWRLGRRLHPDHCDQLVLLAADCGGEIFVRAADDLCRRLARALARGEADELSTSGAALAPGPQEGIPLAVKLLALAPFVRAAQPKLPVWTHHLTDKSEVELRTLYASAAKLGEDAGPLFLEVLSGHLAEPCHVLRLISLLLDQPSDRLLGDSALRPLVERLVCAVESAVARVQGFAPGDGGGEAAGREAMSGAAALLAFDQWIEVTRSGPWTERLRLSRRALALAVEQHLKLTPKIIGEALPTRAVRWSSRSGPRTPKLNRDLDPRAVDRAVDQASFLAAVRASPSTSGFAALLADTCEELDEQLDAYVEALLDLFHSSRPEERPRAQAFLDAAARIAEAYAGAPAGRIVRRRAAAAA